MVAGKKTIIFDLDGTLIDSLEDIAVCMNKVLKDLNLPILEDYKYFVGSGVDVLVENVLKNSSQEIKDEVTARFKKEYDQKLHENTKPFEGIYELLDELKKLDYNLAVLSNKPHDFTVKYVDYLFKDYEFIEVHGQKVDVPRKPDPIGAINIAKALNISCEEIYFVGDTMVDMQTAKNAGMIAIGVLWGFRDEKELNEHGADYLVSHPLEILEIIKK